MYEYECHSCGAHFDMLRGMNQSDEDVMCTVCGSAETHRTLSLFASVTRESNGFSASPSTSADLGGSCCSGGSCGCSL
jgi:putative FmdB family regulatory protein